MTREIETWLSDCIGSVTIVWLTTEDRRRDVTATFQPIAVVKSELSNQRREVNLLVSTGK